MNSRTADKTAVRFFIFADAAFLRGCSSNLLAVQQISPERPLKCKIRFQIQTTLSLRAVPTIGSRTNRSYVAVCAEVSGAKSRRDTGAVWWVLSLTGICFAVLRVAPLLRSYRRSLQRDTVYARRPSAELPDGCCGMALMVQLTCHT